MRIARNRRTSRSVNPSLFGKEPTSAQKTVNVAQKLGIGGIANQQGSPVNIFDSALIATNAGSQTITLFKNSSNKSRVFSNWQQLEFKAGETLAVKYIGITIIQLNAPDLSAGTSTIINYWPAGKLPVFSVLGFSMAQLKIANVTVMKDFQTLELLPQFNKLTAGISAYDAVGTANASIIGRSLIELPTVTVVPPNQPVEFTLEVPPITLPAGNYAVMVTLGSQGSIFSPKNTF